MLSELGAVLLSISVACLWIVDWTKSRRIGALERLVREELWCSQVMAWREFVMLPLFLQGCPYIDLSGEGPDRLVLVFSRVFADLPEAAKHNGRPQP